MKIALTLPDGTVINPPGGVPRGGLDITGVNVIFVVIEILMLGALLFAVYQILIGGIALTMSRGHKESIKKAQEQVIFAVVGIVLIFLIFLGVNALSHLLGANLFPFLPNASIH
jgi:hypothetical protein